MYWINEGAAKNVSYEGARLAVNDVSIPQGVIDIREVKLNPGY